MYQIDKAYSNTAPPRGAQMSPLTPPAYHSNMHATPAPRLFRPARSTLHNSGLYSDTRSVGIPTHSFGSHGNTTQRYNPPHQAKNSSNIQTLADENVLLRQRSASLSQRNTELEQKVLELYSENEELKRGKESLEQQCQNKDKVMDLQQHIVNCGAAVRKRHFEQMKYQRGFGDVDESIIQAGNDAAHKGSYLADKPMFDLGYMGRRSLGLICASEEENADSEYEDNAEQVFKDLYNTSCVPKMPRRPFTEAEEFILERRNLRGSLTASSPYPYVVDGTDDDFYKVASKMTRLIRLTKRGIQEEKTGNLSAETKLQSEIEIDDLRTRVTDIIQRYRCRSRSSWRIGPETSNTQRSVENYSQYFVKFLLAVNATTAAVATLR